MYIEYILNMNRIYHINMTYISQYPPFPISPSLQLLRAAVHHTERDDTA